MKMENKQLPRGIRNNNPLNIRLSWRNKWKGQIPPSPSPTGEGRGEAAFCQFESLEWGIRAAFCLLRTYKKKYNLNCIADIIMRWAPPNENQTAQYIRNVCRWTGIGGMQRLTEADWPILIQAMARQETGVELSNPLIERAFEFFKKN